MKTATIGSRYQVVIPRPVRERVGLKPHAKVHVEAGDQCVIIYPLTDTGLRGIGRSLRDEVDATDYVKRLRAEWAARP